MGARLPTFNFLGFTCYWGKSRKGFWRLKYTSRKDRFAAKLKGLREFLWKHLADQTKEILKIAIRVIRGWVNYHHISDNERKVEAFLQQSRRIIFRWINRKGRKHPLNWTNYNKLLKAIEFPCKGKTVSMFQPR
jgi:RNA-directed DNA polymerase